jgi:rhodanese-related sulfurtransferase
MKKVLIIIGVLVVIGIGLSLWLTHRAPELTSLPDNTTIYDVRTADDYTRAHIAGAGLFPLTDLQAGKLPGVSKDTSIAVYDSDGKLSAQAVTILKKAGFTKVFDIGSIANVGNYGLSTVQ